MVKLGTIHLLSINIWTWLRFVIAKQEGKSVFVEHSSPSNSSTFDFGDYKLVSFFKNKFNIGLFCLVEG